MSDIKLSNIPTMNVGRIVDMLGRSYTAIINAGKPLKSFPSVMLWGPPGVGKSQGVRQLAQYIEESTGKKTVVTDVRLLLFNPVDLRGIPTANEDKTLAVWLKPKIFQMDESDDVINILFLDEISAAPQSVQASAYQITLDRKVGEHHLPENCIVIAAGNRTTDKSVAYKMPKALANRLLHIDVEGNFDAWREWAVGAGINEKVVGFLSFRRDLLINFDAASEDLAYATPRSWEMVSNVLNDVSGDVDVVYPLIGGLIGSGIASEFRNWTKIYSQLPSIEDIFNGKRPAVPKSTDTLYALVSSMVAYAREHKDDMVAIAASVEYGVQLPADYAAILFKDYMYIEKDYKRRLMNVPVFAKWLSTKGRMLNGVV